MSKSEDLFHEIAAELPNASEGKMFGALCIKAPNGKAGVMLYKEEMVFKLTGADLEEAKTLKGATLFDPMGGRPMKEWVQLPLKHADKWRHYAAIAMENVRKLKK